MLLSQTELFIWYFSELYYENQDIEIDSDDTTKDHITSWSLSLKDGT